jgi:hypothetical protein
MMVVYMVGISYDELLEAYVDIMVHAFFIWIGLHVETYSWMIGTCFMEDLAYMYGTHHFVVLVHSSTLIYGIT